MIEAKDLRIGNYYLIVPFAENDAISLDEQMLKLLFQFGNFDRIKPIPLTEEWLIKFGFEKKINSEFVQYWSIGKFILYNEYYRMQQYFELSNYYDIVGSSKQIEYVHQLQDLFYALTGGELTI